MHTPSHFLKPEENQISVDSDQEVIHSELICVVMKVNRYSTHNCEIISTLGCDLLTWLDLRLVPDLTPESELQIRNNRHIDVNIIVS